MRRIRRYCLRTQINETNGKKIRIAIQAERKHIKSIENQAINKFRDKQQQKSTKKMQRKYNVGTHHAGHCTK